MQARPASVAHADCQHRCEISAGTVAADHNFRRRDSQFTCMSGYPVQDGLAIVQRAGEWMLRRQPIIGGDNDRLCADTKFATDMVVSVQSAHDESSAMEEDKAAVRLAFRTIDPYRNVAVSRGDRQVLHVRNRRQFWRKLRKETGAQLGDRRRMPWHLGPGGEDRRDLGIEGSCQLPDALSSLRRSKPR